MRLETERLIITEFDLSMAESVHKNSLDDDNRNFVYQGESRQIAKYVLKRA